jgi:glutamine amidotransferase
MKTLIVDYGLCNLDSVRRATEECGGIPFVSGDPNTMKKADRIILPGVGNYSDAMQRIKSSGWYNAIRNEVIKYEIPILGICLGMQLLSTSGYEGNQAGGLDLIHGEVIRLAGCSPETKIPHVGWNEVVHTDNSLLFKGIPNSKDFYFVHSYHLVPENSEEILATTPYCGGFVSAIRKGSIFGVQFHPEKSQYYGLQLIKNFLSI